MFLEAFFRALRRAGEWIQDEDRHPGVAPLSRRTFGKLIGAFVVLDYVPAPPGTGIDPRGVLQVRRPQRFSGSNADDCHWRGST